MARNSEPESWHGRPVGEPGTGLGVEGAQQSEGPSQAGLVLNPSLSLHPVLFKLLFFLSQHQFPLP